MTSVLFPCSDVFAFASTEVINWKSGNSWTYKVSLLFCLGGRGAYVGNYSGGGGV